MPNNNNKVQFDEPGMRYMRQAQGPRQSWPTRMVIRLGLAKDPKQATVVLIAVGVLALVLAFVFWPRSGGFEQVPQPGLQGTSYLSL